jgi:hypothetical protein
MEPIKDAFHRLMRFGHDAKDRALPAWKARSSESSVNCTGFEASATGTGGAVLGRHHAPPADFQRGDGGRGCFGCLVHLR